jgi:thioredoxin 1
MKKLQLNIKTKQFFTWLLILFSVIFLVVLFVLKDTLNNYASNLIRYQAGSDIQKSESALVDSAYNYIKNEQCYEVTFLEFGATGCSACKRMETVMADIRTKYPDKAKVVFLNILKPENQNLMKYYGIAAIPTQVLLNKEGKEFFRHNGFYSTEDLIKSLTLN